MGNIIATPFYPSYSHVLRSRTPLSPIAGLGTLAALPRELRDQVYERILANNGYLDYELDVESYRISNTALIKANLPAVLPLVFIRSNIFIIRTYRANQFLVHFLESTPDGHGFTNVQELQFTSFQHFRGGQESADLQLAKRCRGLRRLKLTFHVEKLRKPIDPYLYTSKDVSEVVEYYKLRDLFDCKKLVHITLDGIDAWWSQTDLAPGNSLTQVLEDLANWIRDGFAEQKQHVVVDVSWWY
ncbi:Nn.00g061890.m01.CDS01 [Neocucurbitaria sp. VM-36]